MIKPVNGHLLIEPIKHEQFIASQTDTYQEIGKVVDNGLKDGGRAANDYPAVGDKVYFDSWLAAKFPGDKEGDYYWLVKWEHVRAVEHAE